MSFHTGFTRCSYLLDLTLPGQGKQTPTEVRRGKEWSVGETAHPVGTIGYAACVACRHGSFCPGVGAAAVLPARGIDVVEGVRIDWIATPQSVLRAAYTLTCPNPYRD